MFSRPAASASFVSRVKSHSNTNCGDRDKNDRSLEPSRLFPFSWNLKNWIPEQIIMSSTKLFDLSGRVAVLTGGNGGIGRGIALGLAQAGSAVAVLARNEEKNQRVMDELHALGVPALAVKIDLAER